MAPVEISRDGIIVYRYLALICKIVLIGKRIHGSFVFKLVQFLFFGYSLEAGFVPLCFPKIKGEK